jgi:hypothetical protein
METIRFFRIMTSCVSDGNRFGHAVLFREQMGFRRKFLDGPRAWAVVS